MSALRDGVVNLGGSVNFPADRLGGLNHALANFSVLLFLPLAFYFLSNVFWKFYYPDPLHAPPAESAPSKPAERAARAPAVVWDWFVVREQRRSKPAEATKLKATLLGVLGIGDRGVAMIRVDGKKTKAYHVGDELKEGTLLSRLGRDHVILLRGDKEEKLSMKKVNLFEAGGEAAAAPAGGGEPRSDALAAMLKNEPFDLLRLIRFDQTRIKQHGLGFKVVPRNRKGLEVLADSGFQQGDVVLVVNGRPAIQLASEPAAVRKMLGSGELKVRLFRNGEIKDVTVAFK